MRSRSLLFEDEPVPHQPRNTHLVLQAGAMADSCTVPSYPVLDVSPERP
jgi:hypothetical protein